MSFLGGLFAARSHLAFLVGLAAAVGVVRATSRVAAEAPPPGLDALASLERAWPPRAPGPLSPDERDLARAAWAYVVRNSDPGTGLAASVEGWPSTTMWDLGSQLMALLAAEDLGLATREEVHARLDHALTSLARLPLCEGLPNKAYDTRTLAMVDYGNVPAPRGIGWSAIDIGRIAVPLAIIVRRAPELTPAVERAVARWDLPALSDGEALRGASRNAKGGLERYQEGRLGYEQYAARALLAWGVPLGSAVDYRAHVQLVRVSGQLVPRDDRRPKDHGGTHAAVTSEPWILSGLELGLDATGAAMARAVLAAQAARSAATGRLTAVSEDHLDRAPRFAYSAVLNGDDAWTAFDPDGHPAPGALGFSAKAAVGWAALFEGDYSDRLLAAAEALATTDRGVYAGRYDATGEVNHALALNTNAIVLEALAYRTHGPFLLQSRIATAEVPP